MPKKKKTDDNKHKVDASNVIGLHAVVTLVSMFAGVQLFGAVGLFGFPIGLSLLMHLNRTGTIKIFRLSDNEDSDSSDGSIKPPANEEE